MNNDDISAVQSRIGYEFKDTKYLYAAFTHSSYVNEHAAVCNERIEFLGDCVLNFLVGERLFRTDPTAREGALSARRAALVSRAPLARIIDGLGLIRFLRVGAGVEKSAFSDKARSDIFEALLGAVYIDGGLDGCRAVLDNIYYGYVMPEADHKSALQEFAASAGMSVIYDTQADGNEFATKLTVGDKVFAARGKSKRLSQAAAARLACLELMIDC